MLRCEVVVFPFLLRCFGGTTKIYNDRQSCPTDTPVLLQELPRPVHRDIVKLTQEEYALLR